MNKPAITPALMLALMLAATGAHATDTAIKGLTTEGFAALWPDTLGGLKRVTVETEAERHLTIAEYGRQDESTYIRALAYGWPTDNPVPVTAGGEVMAQSIAGVTKAMNDRGSGAPEAFSIDTPGGHRLDCLSSPKVAGTSHVFFCAVPVHGRLMEIQRYDLLEPASVAGVDDQNRATMSELADHLLAGT